MQRRIHFENFFKAIALILGYLQEATEMPVSHYRRINILSSFIMLIVNWW